MAQFASDAFTGTSGTVLTTYSGNWTKHSSSGSGTLVISNANRCRKNSGDNNEALYYHSGSPASADYTVSADLVYISSASGNPSVCGRMSTSANTFYMARYDTTTGGWQLYKRVAGTFTQLGSTSTQTFTSGTKNVLLRMSGTTIELYKEGGGSATISQTDSAITAAGKAGLRNTVDTSDSTGLHIDNLSADDLGATYTLTASAGSFTLTGNATGLVASRNLAVSVGAFTLTGNAAPLVAGRKLAVQAGDFTLTGNGAALVAGRKLTVTTGSFALTGNDATLTYTPAGVTYTLTAGTGAFTLTGNAAPLVASRVLSASVGSFTLTGNVASLVHSFNLIAGVGSFALTGNTTGLVAARTLPASTVAFALTGNDTALTYTPIGAVAAATVSPAGGWSEYLMRPVRRKEREAVERALEQEAEEKKVAARTAIERAVKRAAERKEASKKALDSERKMLKDDLARAKVVYRRAYLDVANEIGEQLRQEALMRQDDERRLLLLLAA